MPSQTLNTSLPTRVIHQFTRPTWIENLAVRSNGQLLVTLLTTPDLYLIDPTTTPPSSTLVHKFTSTLAVTGIIELAIDIFYVCTGNFNVAAYKNEQGSYTVWEVDLRGYETQRGEKVGIKKVVDIKGSGLLNGMELLSLAKQEVLIADSEVGCVWKVNVGTGEHSNIIHVDEMKIPTAGLPMGINGLKIRDGYLYWTNTGREQLCRIQIDNDGKAVGEAEVLAEDCVGDDFVFDKEGNAWITQNPENTVLVVKAAAKEQVLVAGNKKDLEVCGGTACQFGRVEGEERILYVTTTGGLAGPLEGGITEGGKVVAVDTTKFYS